MALTSLCKLSHKLSPQRSKIMGSRERHEATKARSTAALLQERFRELQRKKQMREERQLLKILTPSNVKTHESSSSFVNHPSSNLRSPPHVSLTLWPASDDKQEFHSSFGTSSANMSSNSYSQTQSSEASWNNVYDCGSDSGVDTSLHL